MEPQDVMAPYMDALEQYIDWDDVKCYLLTWLWSIWREEWAMVPTFQISDSESDVIVISDTNSDLDE